MLVLVYEHEPPFDFAGVVSGSTELGEVLSNHGHEER